MFDPKRFAETWIADWNAHDLSAILSHYADDVEFHSPKAVALVGDGTVRGIGALAAYWELGLARRPKLAFRLEATFVGHRSITLLYSGEDGRRATETLLFDANDKVVRATACYDPPITV